MLAMFGPIWMRAEAGSLQPRATTSTNRQVAHLPRVQRPIRVPLSVVL